MRHFRSDYNRFTDPAGKIAEDEPVIIFRAQDKFAPVALKAYLDALALNHGPEDLQDSIRAAIDAFDKWPKKKTPDLPKKAAEPQGDAG